MHARLCCAGVCRAPEWALAPGGRWRHIDVPALFAVLFHARAGVILFDTGYSPRFHDATRRFPFFIYRVFTPVRVTAAETAAAQVARFGVDPGEVTHVIVSHFDPDHIGGLADFPRARVVCAGEAHRAVAGRTGFAALRQRLLPELLPADLAARLALVERFGDPGFGPFTAAHDLLCDGAIRLVPLPGHAVGQIGALVTLADGRRWFLAGDGCWSRATLAAGGGAVHPRLAEDRAAQFDTYRRLAALAAAHPDITLIPSHCPAAAAELLARPGRRPPA